MVAAGTAEIWSQIEAVEGVTVLELFPVDCVSGIRIDAVSRAELREETSDVVVGRVCWFQRSPGDLLAVQMEGKKVEVAVFKFVRIQREISIESSVVHYSQHHPLGELAEEQGVVGEALLPLREMKHFDFHSGHRILCGFPRQHFFVRQSETRSNLQLSHPQFGRDDLQGVFTRSHQYERILGPRHPHSQGNAVQQVTILIKYVGVDSADHVESLTRADTMARLQTGIHGVAFSRRNRIVLGDVVVHEVECRAESGVLGVGSVIQVVFYVSSVSSDDTGTSFSDTSTWLNSDCRVLLTGAM